MISHPSALAKSSVIMMFLVQHWLARAVQKRHPPNLSEKDMIVTGCHFWLECEASPRFGSAMVLVLALIVHNSPSEVLLSPSLSNSLSTTDQ